MTSGEFAGLDASALAKLLARLLGQAGIGIAVTDNSGRVSMLNAVAERLLERPFCAASPAELPHFYHLYDQHGLRPLVGDELPLSRQTRRERRQCL